MREYFRADCDGDEYGDAGVRRGCKPRNGRHHARHWLTQPSGSNEFTPIANTLNLPTEGTATIRIDGARLHSGDHEIAPVGTGTAANVTIDPASTALGGRKGTLRVENGKLFLSIVPAGLMVIIR